MANDAFTAIPMVCETISFRANFSLERVVECCWTGPPGHEETSWLRLLKVAILVLVQMCLLLLATLTPMKSSKHLVRRLFHTDQ
jgi:hypothetical protein